jgi:hypothetical protein
VIKRKLGDGKDQPKEIGDGDGEKEGDLEELKPDEGDQKLEEEDSLEKQGEDLNGLESEHLMTENKGESGGVVTDELGFVKIADDARDSDWASDFKPEAPPASSAGNSIIRRKSAAEEKAPETSVLAIPPPPSAPAAPAEPAKAPPSTSGITAMFSDAGPPQRAGNTILPIMGSDGGESAEFVRLNQKKPAALPVARPVARVPMAKPDLSPHREDSPRRQQRVFHAAKRPPPGPDPRGPIPDSD